MVDYMGLELCKNIVFVYFGFEEVVMVLYWLYKNELELKDKFFILVWELDYYNLVIFWIENRGYYCGFLLWGMWGYWKLEKWIKDVCYY